MNELQYSHSYLNLRSGMKCCLIEERQPSAAISKSPIISIVSPVWRTLHLTVIQVLSLETEKVRKKCPQRTIFDGSELYKRLYTSAQYAALKLKFSSLVRIRLTFFSLSVTWFYIYKPKWFSEVRMFHWFEIQQIELQQSLMSK